MILHEITTPGLSINTYLVIDRDTREAAVIDPTRILESLSNLIAKENCTVTSILETHVHADFVSGSKELKALLNEKPKIYCSGLGGGEWIPSYCDVVVSNKQVISIGNLKLQAWHTPGHTPEHIMWVAFEGSTDSDKAKLAFTGDFLLYGSIGRPDLLGTNNVKKLSEDLYESIFSVLPQLPDAVAIYPAHGAGSLCAKSIRKGSNSTLEIERHTNPYLKYLPQAEWIQKALDDLPEVPDYFYYMKELNVIGPPLLKDLPLPFQLYPEELTAGIQQGILAIDVRSKEDFASAHPTGAINIPLNENFVKWVAALLGQDEAIILIADNENNLKHAISTMRLVGFNNIRGTFLWDLESLKNIPEAIQSIPILSGKAITEKSSRNTPNESFNILDVRTDPEWLSGHIKGATHIEINKIPSQLATLSRKKTWGVVCGSGYRASIVASQLQNAGFPSVFIVQGGMNDWIKSGLPITNRPLA
jgi:hydroxyacylglutathione hydrolase